MVPSAPRPASETARSPRRHRGSSRPSSPPSKKIFSRHREKVRPKRGARASASGKQEIPFFLLASTGFLSPRSPPLARRREADRPDRPGRRREDDALGGPRPRGGPPRAARARPDRRSRAAPRAGPRPFGSGRALRPPLRGEGQRYPEGRPSPRPPDRPEGDVRAPARSAPRAPRRSRESTRTASTRGSSTRCPASSSTWASRRCTSTPRIPTSTFSFSTRRRPPAASTFSRRPSAWSRSSRTTPCGSSCGATASSDARFSEASRGGATLLRAADSVLGLGFLADLADFFRAFDGLYDGFKERSREATRLLAEGRFLVATTLDFSALATSAELAAGLARRGAAPGLILNRVSPRLTGAPGLSPAARGASRARPRGDGRVHGRPAERVLASALVSQVRSHERYE